MIVAVDVKCIVHPSQLAKSTEKRRVAGDRLLQQSARFKQAPIGPAAEAGRVDQTSSATKSIVGHQVVSRLGINRFLLGRRKFCF